MNVGYFDYLEAAKELAHQLVHNLPNHQEVAVEYLTDEFLGFAHSGFEESDPSLILNRKGRLFPQDLKQVYPAIEAEF